jgi:DNA-binding NtrC family response regulator
MTPVRGEQERLRVLIVDDDPAQRDTLAALLEDFSSVEQADRVGEARVLLFARSRLALDFHVVVLDVNLPDGKGTALLPYVGSAAVILVSGDSECDEFRTTHPSVRQRATKPYDGPIMIRWVTVLGQIARLKSGRSWTPMG